MPMRGPAGARGPRTAPLERECRLVQHGVSGVRILGDVREQVSLYERAGGMAYFEALVAAFYRGVATDDLLRPMYPEEELEPATRRLTLFLAQYWGGPRTYDEERGHPRLRQRHFPFTIDPSARDRWLVLMRSAMVEVGTPPEVAAELDRYFALAAEAMRNQD